MNHEPELGRRTSRELTAVRRALGAITAARQELVYIDRYDREKDPAFYDIARDLMLASAALEKYQRTGRPRKSPAGGRADTDGAA